MAAADDKIVAAAKKALANAAEKVAEAKTIEEATQWQVIQNQQSAILDKYEDK